MRPGYALRHILLQQGEHPVPLGAVERDALLQVGVERAAAHELRRDVLVEDGRAEVQRLLADIDLVQQRFGAEDPAEPEAGGEDLGETPQVQGPLRRERIDRGHRFAAVAQLAVGAVLHDEEIVFAREFYQRLPLLQRHRLSARILEIRDHVAELDRPAEIERVQRPHVGAVGPEGLQGAEVGRARGQDHVAGVRQHTRADVDPLLRGGGDLDVRHRHAAAPRDHLPQLRHTLRSPILKGLGAILFEHLRADAADVVDGESGRVGVAAGEGIDGGEIDFLEDLADRRAHERAHVLREKPRIIRERNLLRRTGQIHVRESAPVRQRPELHRQPRNPRLDIDTENAVGRSLPDGRPEIIFRFPKNQFPLRCPPPAFLFERSEVGISRPARSRDFAISKVGKGLEGRRGFGGYAPVFKSGCDSGRGNARAAGERLPLDPLLERPHPQRPVGIDRHEIGVGPDRREKRIPAGCAAFLFHVHGLRIRHETHEMARPRVQEPAVQRGTELPHVDHPQAHRLAATLAGEDLARVQPVGRGEAVHPPVARGDAQRIGKRHDAASAVAAHHPAGAVGIVILHPEIQPLSPFGQDHQAVGAVLRAERGDALRRAEGGDILRPPVQDHEVVAGTGIFMQFRHQRNRSSRVTDPAVFSSRYFTMTGQ